MAEQDETTTYITDKIDAVRYNPSAMMQVILLELEKFNGGDIVNINPANPAVAALEAATVTASTLHSAHAKSLRALYPLLSESNSELYNHMSDDDYKDLFSSYARTYISIALLTSDISDNGVYVNTDSGGYHQLTIPKYTVFKVSNISLLLLYPVNIRKYPNGTIRISMDNSNIHPLEAPRDGVINTVTIADDSRVEWTHFKIPVVQLDVFSSEYTIVVGNNIKESINYSNKYYTANVYIKTGTGGWTRIKTTHSDIVYDKDEITAKLTLKENNVLTVEIPPVYMIDGELSGVMRVVLYTTNGEVSIDLADFPIDAFSKKVRVVDQSDSNEYTAAFNASNIGIYGTSLLEGGHNGLSFSDVRKNVIRRVTGRINTPVTNAQISAMAVRDLYSVYTARESMSEVDVLFTKRLVADTQTDAIATQVQYSAVVSDILENTAVKKNNNIIVIPSNTVFSIDGDIVEMVPEITVNNIRSETIGVQISKIKDLNGFYTPFYHILDMSNDMLLHNVYHMDAPGIDHISFVSANTRIEEEVNTNTYTLTKSTSGYTLEVTTKSTSGFKELGPETAYAQIVITKGLKKYHINGVRNPRLTTEDEIVFTFSFATDIVINAEHKLLITNMVDDVGVSDDVYLDLQTDIHLYYISTSPNIPHEYSDLDREISLLGIGNNGIAITKEKYNVVFGAYLDRIYSLSSMYYRERIYKKYDTDIPAVYDKDIYQVNPKNGSYYFIDPDTCEVTTNIIHRKGDRQRTPSGDVIIKHRIGDPIIGNDGQPVVDKEKSVMLSMAMTLVEAEYLFATAPEYTNIRTTIANTIAHRSTTVIGEYHNKLPVFTNGYYGAHKTHGIIKTPNGFISSRNTVSITIYVRGGIRLDSTTKDLLKNTVTDIIVQMSYTKELVLDSIRTLIREQLGDIIQNIQIEGMGDANKTGIITISRDSERYSLGKQAIISQDGYLAAAYDIEYSILEA